MHRKSFVMCHKSGFTLLELLAVIAIMGILASITVANWDFLQEQFRLNQEAHKMAQSIQRVEQMAAGAQELPPGITCGAGEEFVGYGIYFTEVDTLDAHTKYEIFANCKDTNTGDEMMVEIEQIDLEFGIVISSVAFTPGGDPIGEPIKWNGVRISFFPPDPRTQIAWDANNVMGNVREETHIILQLGSRERTITVNNKGAIEVE